MLESPAFRVLSQSAHRVLARLEIELSRHGGKDNGRLPVTFDDFTKYGIDRHAVAPAIRELEALGFLEITQRGRAGNAEWRTPNRFRLTYIYAKDSAPTHEWRRIQSITEATKIAKLARMASVKTGRSKGRPEKSCPTPMGKKASAGDGIPHRKHKTPSEGNAHHSNSGEFLTTLDISGKVQHSPSNAVTAQRATKSNER